MGLDRSITYLCFLTDQPKVSAINCKEAVAAKTFITLWGKIVTLFFPEYELICQNITTDNNAKDRVTYIMGNHTVTSPSRRNATAYWRCP